MPISLQLMALDQEETPETQGEHANSARDSKPRPRMCKENMLTTKPPYLPTPKPLDAKD